MQFFSCVLTCFQNSLVLLLVLVIKFLEEASLRKKWGSMLI